MVQYPPGVYAMVISMVNKAAGTLTNQSVSRLLSAPGLDPPTLLTL